MIITFETSVSMLRANGNITTFYTTHDFQSNNLIIQATSNTAKNNWYSAGFLSQVFVIGGKDIVAKKTKINLNEYQLFKCVMIDPVESFKLKIDPANWLRDISLNFWSTSSQFSDTQISNEDLQDSIRAVNQRVASIATNVNQANELLKKINKNRRE